MGFIDLLWNIQLAEALKESNFYNDISTSNFYKY